jgi:NAD(P)-dependent dehydrogenase (short-subunit alcohol dehydrogenase family)
VRADVRFEDEVAALMDETTARFGRIDTAVNNAGIDGHFDPIWGASGWSFAAGGRARSTRWPMLKAVRSPSC